MKIRDLIQLLEKEAEEQEKYRDIFGEPTIALWVNDEGFTHDFRITHTPDGVYAVLIHNNKEESHE